ncbi:hypothetical protein NLU13_4640 [Sarocladium strictum]|uniref:GPI-anchored cell surface glycoprotein n=1 Tax=Sarocladium strictum TaxID=5046 RepID=A0AA39L8D0_SARSR|nr:hypothetical protein NLU13_4640 [Sarocladium strictum]
MHRGIELIVSARVAVHYNAVCERFSPHDTTFEITTAEELRDSKLSAACSLHAASASNSSSSSSNRRRRLNEIAEEDEDELQQRAPKRQSMTLNNEELAADTSLASTEPAVTLNSELAASPDQSKFSAASTSDIPQFVGADAELTSPTDSIESSRRMSSQSGRQESLNYAYYPYNKPKVKLGPRPSLDVSARPQTAGNFRPVSSIPPGLKMFGIKGSKKSKSKDSDGVSSPTEELSLPSSVPASEESGRTYFEAPRPNTSSGVTLAPKSPSAMSSVTIKQGMTPEKARIMKAKKMREKKKAQAAQPPVPAIPAFEKPAQPAEEEPPAISSPEEPEHPAQQESEEQLDHESKKRIVMIKADSAIAIDGAPDAATAYADEASVLTQSDSRPASPLIASSDADHSTKASSISELTDETVECKQVKTEDRETVQETAEELESTEVQTRAEVEEIKEVVAATKVEAEPAAAESDAIEDKSGNPEASAEDAQAHVAHEMPDDPIALKSDDDGPSESAPAIVGVPEPVMVAPVSKFSSKGAQPNANASNVHMANGEKTPVQHEDKSQPEHPNLQDNEMGIPPPQSSLTRQYSVSKKEMREATKAAASPSAVLEGPTVFLDQSALAEDESDAQVVDDHSDAETISASTKPKRKHPVEPIRTDLPSRPASRTETDFADDESLLNELQSATMEEAKPMLVAKTPVTPVFSNPFSADTPPRPSSTNPPASRGGHMVRTVSNPVRGSLVMPPSDVSQSSARSMSGGAAYLHKITQQQQAGANLAKKTNMGSSISKRIKALEMLSVESKDTKPVVAGRERPSSTFFSVKKGRTPSRSPSVLERASSFNIKPEIHTIPHSRDGSPEAEKQLARRQRERSGSVASRLSMFEPPTGAPSSSHHSPHNSPRGRPESISVTAKIIRDPEAPLESHKDPSQFGHLDLKQSPLVVDHQRAEPAPPSGPAEAMAALLGSKETIQERRISRESIRSQSHERGKGSTSRRSSLSIVKDFIKERRRSITSQSNEPLVTPTLSTSGSKSPSRPPSVHQTSSISHRLSFSSHRSSFSRDREMGASSPIPPETPGFDVSADEVKSMSSEKRRSRAGRLMRRLSNLGSRGKISTPAGLAATVTEEEIIADTAPPRPATTATSTAPAILSYMGDVNVQFPDNLLWKRRNLCLDAAGYILLSVSAEQQTTRAGAMQGTKRYHLSDFRRPYAPDVEVQELPNSVVLDFMEGSGLQFACEDRAGQANVLRILQDAHSKHSLMFQV